MFLIKKKKIVLYSKLSEEKTVKGNRVIMKELHKARRNPYRDNEISLM